MKNLVILGTARDDSNTLKAITTLCPFNDYELIDLRKYQIGQYEYDQAINAKDDFSIIAAKMEKTENVIFATPVYWYGLEIPFKLTSHYFEMNYQKAFYLRF